MDSQSNRQFLCQRPSLEDVNHQHLVKIVNPISFQSLPPSVDFSDKLPPVYDQLSLGSCASNAGALAYNYTYPLIDPSRLFLYFNARTRNNPNAQYTDSGSSITDVMSVLQQIGICQENLWPYNISQFTVKPSENCYQIASNHKIIAPVNISTDINTLRSVLANNKPIVFGLKVYDSIFQLTAQNPVYYGTGNLCGGHATTICGYDDQKQLFKIRNSWVASGVITGASTVHIVLSQILI
jgi:C1A family cysteine protease